MEVHVCCSTNVAERPELERQRRQGNGGQRIPDGALPRGDREVRTTTVDETAGQ